MNYRIIIACKNQNGMIGVIESRDKFFRFIGSPTGEPRGYDFKLEFIPDDEIVECMRAYSHSNRKVIYFSKRNLMRLKALELSSTFIVERLIVKCHEGLNSIPSLKGIDDLSNIAFFVKDFDAKIKDKLLMGVLSY